MIYGYVNDEEERAVLAQYAQTEHLQVDDWLPHHKHSLPTLKKLHKNDVLLTPYTADICSSLAEFQKVVQLCVQKQIKVIITQDNLMLDNSVVLNLLLPAIEMIIKVRQDITSRATKKTLSKLKAEGKSIGRAKGSLNKKYKLSGKEPKIKEMLDQNYSQIQIANHLGVNRKTLAKFLSNLNAFPA